MRDYYIVLGVGRGADRDKIHKAYRAVVKKYHPDVARNRESAGKFLEIRDAYETLSDEEKRKQYDAELEREGSSLRIREVPDIVQARRERLERIEDLFSSSVDEFLEGFLPGFFDLSGRNREKDLYFEAILSAEEALARRAVPSYHSGMGAVPPVREIRPVGSFLLSTVQRLRTNPVGTHIFAEYPPLRHERNRNTIAPGGYRPQYCLYHGCGICGSRREEHSMKKGR